jgi:hypothetical protein
MARQISPNEWGRLIANAWLDEKFAHELSTKPAETAKKFLGLDPHAEVHLFDIPPKPGDLSNDQIEEIRNGRLEHVIRPPYSC